MNKLEVLYEDNHLIVVVKPANMLSQSDHTKDLDLLTQTKQYIKEKYQKPGNVYLGLVHRLDRPVGGIMVFARTSKAASRLSEQIRTHQFQKTYLAVVDGILKDKKKTLKHYVTKQENQTTIVTDEKHGKLAELSYEVLEENKEQKKSLIQIQLKTGRHHQIRVQFQSIGHPLCGDQRYGKQDHTQLALFASKLCFSHPVKKELMQFETKPSKEGYWTLFTL